MLAVGRSPGRSDRDVLVLNYVPNTEEAPSTPSTQNEGKSDRRGFDPPPDDPDHDLSRSKPTQTFTQPSAPAMQAPSHAISVSNGTTTPCTSGYARSRYGGSFGVGGNNSGTCVLRK